MNMSDHFVCVNGNIIKQKNAVIPAFHSGLFYGAGCFETFRVDYGDCFRFEEHISRLKRGLTYLGVPKQIMPDLAKLQSEILELLAKSSLDSEIAKVRIQISLNDTPGYGFDSDTELIKLISCSRIEENQNLVRLKLSDIRTIPFQSRPADLKLSNMLHYRAAFRDAQKSGFDDALMLNQRGFAAETSIANIFWIAGDHIYTPSLRTDILPGIMRATLISIIKKIPQLTITEGEFGVDAIKKADAVWITNSVKEISEVQCFEDIKFRKNHGIFDTLREGLIHLKNPKKKI